MTDPLLIVDHLQTIASRLVDALNRQSASGLITRDILKLTGELQQALWVVEQIDRQAIEPTPLAAE